MPGVSDIGHEEQSLSANDNAFTKGLANLVTFAENSTALDDLRTQNEAFLAAQKARDDAVAAERTRQDRERQELDDIDGGGDDDQPEVKAGFVWHIMYAAFALLAVLLLGYLSKRNVAKGAHASKKVPMGAATNNVPKPMKPTGLAQAQRRDLDEEKYQLLAKMIGSMESKPAPVTFHINASGASGQQQEALKTLAEFNLKPSLKPKPKGAPQPKKGAAPPIAVPGLNTTATSGGGGNKKGAKTKASGARGVGGGGGTKKGAMGGGGGGGGRARSKSLGSGTPEAGPMGTGLGSYRVYSP